MNKELHNRTYTFAKALSMARRNKHEPKVFKYYLALAHEWAKSDTDLQLIENLINE
jgi:hypothetical protein